MPLAGASPLPQGPLRILLVTETYPPEINGVAMTTERRVRGLRARKVWVGDGPSLARLRAAHPDHHFAGPRGGENLAAHYAGADLFLFGSLSET
ncbi:MAG: hypothetical protein Q8O33_16290 [Pseudomonadota bacterium]|nr:hypothetical protein [Pseudomonadota bacterium]